MKDALEICEDALAVFHFHVRVQGLPRALCGSKVITLIALPPQWGDMSVMPGSIYCETCRLSHDTLCGEFSQFCNPCPDLTSKKLP